ncbi:spore coat protein CotF [Desulfohalotomaculum tongense]|uniref:spore coat protein n=1 Tax=Desulforadius tongensis TaxID=1216062 RepID=UPI00195EE905|nr:spore coat protein [Desulforadius tongensis]MBM7854464.1 spore coat protein CotF [Desulforadius tongensis]
MVQLMDQIRDKDLAFAMLNDLKSTCECITQKILETSNEQLRQSYLNVLHETFNEHKQLYNMMSQRGWYKPMMAKPDEINQISSHIMSMQNEINQTINAVNYQQQHYGGTQYNYQPGYYQGGMQGHQPY